MDIKLVEIRDSGTFIPAMAVQLCARIDEEAYLLRRAGFAEDEGYIMLTRLDTAAGQHDPDEWPVNPRTMRHAHYFIIARWHEIKSGDVIDVQYLLKETERPKASERLTDPL